MMAAMDYKGFVYQAWANRLQPLSESAQPHNAVFAPESKIAKLSKLGLFG